MAVLANFSFLGLLMLGALAWGFARVLDAPKGAIRAIPLVMILIALFSQIALPETAPFRQSVRGALTFGLYAAVLAIPVLGYRTLLRRLRRKSGATQEPPPHPVGFVLIDADAALAEDTRKTIEAGHATRADWAPATFSVAHRDAAGRITGTARGVLNMGLVDIQGLHSGSDGPSVAELLEQVEDEARRRGASRAAITLYDWQAEALAAARDYTETGRTRFPAGAHRVTLEKDLA